MLDLRAMVEGSMDIQSAEGMTVSLRPRGGDALSPGEGWGVLAVYRIPFEALAGRLPPHFGRPAPVLTARDFPPVRALAVWLDLSPRFGDGVCISLPLVLCEARGDPARLTAALAPGEFLDAPWPLLAWDAEAGLRGCLGLDAGDVASRAPQEALGALTT